MDEAFESLNTIVSSVIPIHKFHVAKAREMLNFVSGVSARDALHLAVMEHAEINRILSCDTGFDAIPGIERLE